MSTLKTPMERAALAKGRPLDLDSNDGCDANYLDGFIAGDADRERLMKEESSKGFDEWWVNQNLGWRIGNIEGEEEMCRTTWIKAQSDRAELIQCVLEMAIQLKHDKERREKEENLLVGYMINHPLRKYADLINKLKQESANKEQE